MSSWCGQSDILSLYSVQTSFGRHLGGFLTARSWKPPETAEEKAAKAAKRKSKKSDTKSEKKEKKSSKKRKAKEVKQEPVKEEGSLDEEEDDSCAESEASKPKLLGCIQENCAHLSFPTW